MAQPTCARKCGWVSVCVYMKKLSEFRSSLWHNKLHNYKFSARGFRVRCVRVVCVWVWLNECARANTAIFAINVRPCSTSSSFSRFVCHNEMPRENSENSSWCGGGVVRNKPSNLPGFWSWNALYGCLVSSERARTRGEGKKYEHEDFACLNNDGFSMCQKYQNRRHSNYRSFFWLAVFCSFHCIPSALARNRAPRHTILEPQQRISYCVCVCVRQF